MAFYRRGEYVAETPEETIPKMTWEELEFVVFDYLMEAWTQDGIVDLLAKHDLEVIGNRRLLAEHALIRLKSETKYNRRRSWPLKYGGYTWSDDPNETSRQSASGSSSSYRSKTSSQCAKGKKPPAKKASASKPKKSAKRASANRAPARRY